MSAVSAERRALAMAHYEVLARVGKAMASPVRLRLLDLLRQGPSSVEDIAEQAGVSVANASQHLQQLRSARLVLSRKDAQRVIYRLSDDAVSFFFGAMRELAEALMPEMDRLQEALDVYGDEERDVLVDLVRKRKVTLIDVRPAQEYEAGHIAGALNVPLTELRARLSEIPKSKEVIAYCRGPYCPLALEAVSVLSSAGFRARHLDLGAPDLKARRFKLEIVNGGRRK